MIYASETPKLFGRKISRFITADTITELGAYMFSTSGEGFNIHLPDGDNHGVFAQQWASTAVGALKVLPISEIERLALDLAKYSKEYFEVVLQVGPDHVFYAPYARWCRSNSFLTPQQAEFLSTKKPGRPAKPLVDKSVALAEDDSVVRAAISVENEDGHRPGQMFLRTRLKEDYGISDNRVRASIGRLVAAGLVTYERGEGKYDPYEYRVVKK